MATLISDKVTLKTKSVTSDKEGHFILIKGSVHPEDRIVLKIYVPNKSFKIHEIKIDRNTNPQSCLEILTPFSQQLIQQLDKNKSTMTTNQ